MMLEADHDTLTIAHYDHFTFAAFLPDQPMEVTESTS